MTGAAIRERESTVRGAAFEGKLTQVDMHNNFATVDIPGISRVRLSFSAFTHVHRPLLLQFVWSYDGCCFHAFAGHAFAANVRRGHYESYLALVYDGDVWAWSVFSSVGGGKLAAQSWCEDKLRMLEKKHD